jgi:hypothetical protein
MLHLKNNFQIPTFKNRDKPTISRLTNSHRYFIDLVIIQKKDDSQYRLFARHKQTVLIDQTYPTLRGAKISFSKLFKKKAWNDDLKATWTIFYQPDRPCFDEKLKIAEKAH